MERQDLLGEFVNNAFVQYLEKAGLTVVYEEKVELAKNIIEKETLQEKLVREMCKEEVEEVEEQSSKKRKIKRVEKSNEGRRVPFTENQLRILNEWVEDHRESPYPKEEEKIAISHQTGLSIKQICDWLANWRKRKWKHNK